MDIQQYQGQMLGTYSGEPVSVKTDADGNLIHVASYQEVTILSSAARTTSGNTGTTIAGKYKEAIAFIDVTAASGTTPTLDVKFQTQDPVSLKWFDLTSLTFTQRTAVATEMKTQSSLLGSKLRCVYTIGGTTPSFTFSVSLILKS